MDRTGAVDDLMRQLHVERITVNTPAPATITELVNANGGPGRGGGVRAVARMLPDSVNPRTGQPVSIESKMRSVQRYMNAEQHTGKQARGTSEKGYAEAKANLNAAFGTAKEKTEAANKAAQAQVEAQKAGLLTRYPGGVQLSVTGDVHVSSKIEPGRSIDSELTPDDLADIYDAWIEGRDGDAADAFRDDFFDNYDLGGGDWDAISDLEVWSD